MNDPTNKTYRTASGFLYPSREAYWQSARIENHAEIEGVHSIKRVNNGEGDDRCEDEVPKGVLNGIEDIESGNTASMSDLKEVFDSDG